MAFQSNVISFLFSFVILSSALGQDILQSNPFSIALASCDATLSNELAAYSNPAGLGSVNEISFALMYENRYNLKDLATKSGIVVVPSKFGTIGLSIAQFGFSEFHSSRYTLAYSRIFGKNVSAGIQFNFRSDYAANADHFNTLYTDFGLIYHPSKKITIGFHILNPEQSSINYPNYTAKISSEISVGIAWHFIESSSFYSQITKEFNTSPNISSAIESNINKIIVARFGYSYTHHKIGFGLGVIINSFTTNIGFAYEEPLGAISSIALAYKIFK